MLVLSRRQNDKVVFPNLGITVHVVRISGNTVRLGIEAPKDIPVVRHEIADQWSAWNDYPVGQRPEKLSHALRNRLNAAVLGLHLLHRQLETESFGDVEPTILRVFRELDSMEQEVARIKDRDSDTTTLPPRRALLVEDNDNECQLLAGYLRSCNFQVATACDGVAALEFLACHERPDVILLDMTMPRLDGLGTINEIRGNPLHAGLKVFAVSGLSPRQAGVVTGAKGIDRWFVKPLDPEALVGAIDLELSASVA